MAYLRASEQGKKRIEQARNDRGWIVEDPRWLVEASKILEPSRNWETLSFYAEGISLGSWKAFLYNVRKKGTRAKAFKAYCQVLGLSWEEIREVTDKVVASQGNNDWRKFCRDTLNYQKQSTIDVLTGRNGVTLDKTFVPLGLIERQKCDSKNSQLPPLETEYKVIQKFQRQEEFFEQVLCQGQSSKSPNSKGRRIAITGESGSGKTTLLLKIGFWVLENTEDVPIWISLKDIGEKTLNQYLKEDWLSRVDGMLEELKQCLKSERVWLLLDGVEDLAAKLNAPFRKIGSELTGLTDKARVVLTCRTSIWKEDLYALDAFGFDTYQSLGLNPERVKHPERVKQLIEDWFSGNYQLAQQLQTELEQPAQWRIKDLAQNPLHLVILCRTWQQWQGRLPETKVELFEQLIREDCKRKVAKRFPREALIKDLGVLALEALNQKELRYSSVQEKLGEDRLRLVLQLGWLRRVSEREEVYDFLHDSFKEYFAAKAIEQWDYFLKHNNENPNPFQKYNGEDCLYRIFNPQWKEVILLWLGCPENNLRRQKEKLIKKLVNFRDDCCNFYRYQAIFLVAAGIVEFSSIYAENIVSFIMELVFDDENPEWYEWYQFFRDVAIIEIIPETDRYRVINEVIDEITILRKDNVLDNIPYISAIEILENLGIAEQRVIDSLLNVLFNSQDKDVIECTLSALKKLGFGNELLIEKLLEIFDNANSVHIRELAIECLENVAHGNLKAVNELTRILSNTKNESTVWKAAYTLAQIDPGNKKALFTLVKLLENPENEGAFRELASYLGSLKAVNQKVLDVLARIILTTDPDNIADEVISSIGDIVTANEDALDCFANLILNRKDGSRENKTHEIYFLDKSKDSFTDRLERSISIFNGLFEEMPIKKSHRSIQKLQLIVKELEQTLDRNRYIYHLADRAHEHHEAIDLKKLFQNYSLYKVVKVFRKKMIDAAREYEYEEPTYWECKVLWYCAKNMSYPDFYDAWHS